MPNIDTLLQPLTLESLTLPKFIAMALMGHNFVQLAVVRPARQ